MALREIVIIAQYDSNLIGHIDLTDGTYNAVEHTHSSCIDDFHRIGNSLYIAFEDYGSRVAKYLGDGKIGPESEDLVPARFNGNAPSGVAMGKKRFPAGHNAFIKITPTDWGDPQNWDIVDEQDNVLISSYPEVSWYSLKMIYPDGFELAPGVTFDPAMLPTLSIQQEWGSERIYYIPNPTCFIDGQLVQFITGSDLNCYEVRSTVGARDENQLDYWHVTPVSTKLVGAISMNQAVLLPNGKFALGNSGNTTVWLWDGVTLTAREEMPYGTIDRISKAIAMGDTAGVFEYSGGEVDWTQRGIAGQDMVRVSMEDLSKTVLTMPAIAEMPAEALSEARGLNVGFHNGIRVKAFRAFKTQAGVETFAGSLLIENYNTGTYQYYADFSARMQMGRLCPMGELDDDGIVVQRLQPFEVTGTVKKAGANTATDLILIDNESLAICGRTKSDPVTGEYKFRCYTNGKKSVFARHPVAGGLRLAAEVIPTAVG